MRFVRALYNTPLHKFLDTPLVTLAKSALQSDISFPGQRGALLKKVTIMNSRNKRMKTLSKL